MNYRFCGKQRTISFGNHPDLPLAKARAMLAIAREALADGKDPMEVRRQLARAEQARTADTFQAISDEWLLNQLAGRSGSTITKLHWLVDMALPKIGQRPITDLTASDLLEVLRKVEERGRYETAARMRSTFGTIFRYAIATGRAQRDPSAALKGALITPKPSHRPAILDRKALGGLLRAIEGHDGQPVVRFALRIAPHVFVRPSELRLAEWSEFDFKAKVWTIPAHKTKMRRHHRVPLSPEVITMLEVLYPMSGDTKYLFPNIRSAERLITDNTLNRSAPPARLR